MAGKALTTFEIKKADDGYTMHIEDDSGDKIEFTATAEQVDAISESLIDILEADDSADADAADEDEE